MNGIKQRVIMSFAEQKYYLKTKVLEKSEKCIKSPYFWSYYAIWIFSGLYCLAFEDMSDLAPWILRQMAAVIIIQTVIASAIFAFCVFIWLAFVSTGILKDTEKEEEKVRYVEVEKLVQVPTIIQIPTTEDVTNRKGYVYIIKGVNTPWFKIGKSITPKRRKRRFDVKMPIALEEEMLLKTDDMHNLESKLHTIFSHRRLDGEWFTLTPDDLHWLRTEFDKS